MAFKDKAPKNVPDDVQDEKLDKGDKPAQMKPGVTPVNVKPTLNKPIKSISDKIAEDKYSDKYYNVIKSNPDIKVGDTVKYIGYGTGTVKAGMQGKVVSYQGNLAKVQFGKEFKMVSPGKLAREDFDLSAVLTSDLFSIEEKQRLVALAAKLK